MPDTFEDDTTCRQMADGFMAPPYFPVTPKYFDADIEYVDFRPPETLTPHDGIVIRTMRLNHPNGCVGYRVDYGGKLGLLRHRSPSTCPAAKTRSSSPS